MRDALRQKVQVRDEYRCLYCGITELDIGSTLTIDHIQPKQQGGTDNVDNLLYCCHACNEFKGKYYKTAPELQLLNPLVDNFAEHYQAQDNGTLLAITDHNRAWCKAYRSTSLESSAFGSESASQALQRRARHLCCGAGSGVKGTPPAQFHRIAFFISPSLSSYPCHALMLLPAL